MCTMGSPDGTFYSIDLTIPERLQHRPRPIVLQNFDPPITEIRLHESAKSRSGLRAVFK